MKIYFERSGGFLGTKLTTAVDTTQLPTDEADEWERVLATNEFHSVREFIEVAFSQKGFDIEFNDELYRVVVHGVLHLCGYMDKEDEEVRMMRNKESEYLKMVSRET